jgi:hypothetical protein
MPLRQFQANEIIISRHDAWKILKFFWPECHLPENELTDQDVAFAQALMVEAIDASYKMGYVHILYDAFYGKIPGSLGDVKDMIKEFAKAAAKHWFKHARKNDLKDAEIYSTVRVTIARNFRSVIALREQTGELLY